MTETPKPLPQLLMKRDNLEDLPPVLLPTGYSLRASREDDGPHWVRILNAAFGFDWTEANFQKAMRDHPAYRPERILFVCGPDGAPCATASAWRLEQLGEQTGMVHWVAAHPEHRGHGLGRALVAAVLRRMREEGCTDAFLSTDDHRLAAIRLYLSVGFHPLMKHESHPARWERVRAELDSRGIAGP